MLPFASEPFPDGKTKNVCKPENQTQPVPEGFEKPQKKRRMLMHPQSPEYGTGE